MPEVNVGSKAFESAERSKNLFCKHDFTFPFARRSGFLV